MDTQSMTQSSSCCSFRFFQRREFLISRINVFFLIRLIFKIFDGTFICHSLSPPNTTTTRSLIDRYHAGPIRDSILLTRSRVVRTLLKGLSNKYETVSVESIESTYYIGFVTRRLLRLVLVR